MANRADRVITCSHYMRDHVADIYDLDEQRVTRDPQRDRPASTSSRVDGPRRAARALRDAGRAAGHAGRPARLREGLPARARGAVRGVIGRLGDVRFLVAGSGTHEAELQAQATRARAGPHGTFLGWIGDDVLHSLYRIADLASCRRSTSRSGSSRSRRWPRGCPCIVADTGGLREIVPERRARRPALQRRRRRAPRHDGRAPADRRPRCATVSSPRRASTCCASTGPTSRARPRRCTPGLCAGACRAARRRRRRQDALQPHRAAPGGDERVDRSKPRSAFADDRGARALWLDELRGTVALRAQSTVARASSRRSDGGLGPSAATPADGVASGVIATTALRTSDRPSLDRGACGRDGDDQPLVILRWQHAEHGHARARRSVAGPRDGRRAPPRAGRPRRRRRRAPAARAAYSQERARLRARCCSSPPPCSHVLSRTGVLESRLFAAGPRAVGGGVAADRAAQRARPCRSHRCVIAAGATSAPARCVGEPARSATERRGATSPRRGRYASRRSRWRAQRPCARAQRAAGVGRRLGRR